MRFPALFLFAALAATPLQAAGTALCGGETPCAVTGGSYRVELPIDGPPRGAYVFFHGYKASAAQMMAWKDVRDAALSHGLAFVAPDGLEGTWSHDGAPGRYRDETAFVGAVLDDIGTRFAIPGSRVIVGGFSQGASMAWYTACHQGDRIAGAITFSGVYWTPLPVRSDCPGAPPPMIHFHGTADRTFPLAGRAIGSHWRQGDTFASLALARTWAGCSAEGAETPTLAGVACEAPRNCARGPITACIHDRGHELHGDWLNAAFDTMLPQVGIGAPAAP